MNIELPVNNCRDFGKHPEVFFTGDKCPVCLANEEADRRVAVVQEKLDSALARIEDYKTELGI